MLLVMSDGNAPADPVWLTYKQAAERLSLPTPEAAEAEAARANWPKRVRDGTGEIEVAAPADLMAHAAQKRPRSRRASAAPSARPDAPALADLVRAASAPLEAVLQRQELANKVLQAALDAARAELGNADAARRIAEAHAADIQRRLEQSDLDRRIAHQQVEALRDQLAAAQVEAAHATGSANTERARRDAAIAKLAALQLQLDEAMQARERRRWWWPWR
jgi:hypothetical protein